jgi:murein DD-endopeptidase MepM/ murein hydrolase activator NlpD
MTNFSYLVALLSVVFLFSCSSEEKLPEKEVTKEVDSTKVNRNEYGLNVDTLQTIEGEVDRNQTLADILLPHGITYPRINKIAKLSKKVFDVRKIKRGNTFKIYTSPDTSKNVHYFVYDESPLTYVVYDLKDSINIYKGKKNVNIKERTVTGVIESSLYETLTSQNVSPLLAIKLSEVFAWQIDFFRVQKGDSFKAIFTEKYVDTSFIGVERVVAAKFTHIDNEFYAFEFEQNGELDYFDEKGQSLRKEFLKAPLKYSRISSGYSYRRYHPILHKYRAHRGIDYAAPRGTPVQSVGDGVVTYRGRKGGAGNYIKIRHNGTYSSGYMHLWKYAKGLHVGKKVKQGEVIGYVGSTGLSTGPHLDFRFWRNGALINYLKVEFPPSHPVNKENQIRYFTYKDFMKAKLDSLKYEAEIKENSKKLSAGG